MIGGRWPNGNLAYMWVPYYGLRQEWVLERWLSAKEFAGEEKDWNIAAQAYDFDEWGQQVPILGMLTFPYPRRGWYEHVYSFPTDAPPNMEAIVPLLEQYKTLTIGQIKAGIALWHERKKKEWEQKVEDGFLDAQGAFHNLPSSVNPGKMTADKVDLAKPMELRSAIERARGETKEVVDEIIQDAPLPSHGMSIRQRRD